MMCIKGLTQYIAYISYLKFPKLLMNVAGKVHVEDMITWLTLELGLGNQRLLPALVLRLYVLHTVPILAASPRT